jgi:hypothetical protein
VTPLDGGDNAPRRAARSSASDRFNQRASSLQVNASKTKQKSLHFLVFPWWNWAFSMGYGRKKYKNPSRSKLASRVVDKRPEFDLPDFPSHRSNSSSGNAIARILFFVKR